MNVVIDIQQNNSEIKNCQVRSCEKSIRSVSDAAFRLGQETLQKPFRIQQQSLPWRKSPNWEWPCFPASRGLSRGKMKREERPLPASDELFEEAADQITSFQNRFRFMLR